MRVRDDVRSVLVHGFPAPTARPTYRPRETHESAGRSRIPLLIASQDALASPVHRPSSGVLARRRGISHRRACASAACRTAGWEPPRLLDIRLLRRRRQCGRTACAAGRQPSHAKTSGRKRTCSHASLHDDDLFQSSNGGTGANRDGSGPVSPSRPG
jgi:hypothetical protein